MLGALGPASVSIPSAVAKPSAYLSEAERAASDLARTIEHNDDATFKRVQSRVKKVVRDVTWMGIDCLK